MINLAGKSVRCPVSIGLGGGWTWCIGRSLAMVDMVNIVTIVVMVACGWLMVEMANSVDMVDQ